MMAEDATDTATTDGEKAGNLIYIYIYIYIHIYIYTFNTQYIVIIYPSEEKEYFSIIDHKLGYSSGKWVFNICRNCRCVRYTVNSECHEHFKT